jgi:hypothetical protein
MLPLGESVKLVVLLLGACQKSPQPAKSVAAAIKPIQLPILITAPYAPHMGAPSFPGTRLQANACQRLMSCAPACPS